MDGEHKIFLDELLLEGFIGELSFLDNLKAENIDYYWNWLGTY